MMYLDTSQLPVLAFSHYRQFVPGEKHITRFCDEEVAVFLFSGVLRFVENGVPVEVHPGEYYIQKRRLFQQGLLPSDSPYYYYIHFYGEWSETDGIRPHGRYPDEIRPLFQKLDELCQLNASVLAQNAVFYDILSRLPNVRPASAQNQLAEEIRQELYRHVSSSFSLNDLSAKLHFSPNYLIRVFRSVYGQTPYDYLLRLRLEKAEQLMRYSDLSMKAIASECGFGSYANFYKAFHRHRGVAPGEWQKK